MIPEIQILEVDFRGMRLLWLKCYDPLSGQSHGSLGTVQQIQNNESYCYVCMNGDIIRLNALIGHRMDIKEIGEYHDPIPTQA